MLIYDTEGNQITQQDFDMLVDDNERLRENVVDYQHGDNNPTGGFVVLLLGIVMGAALAWFIIGISGANYGYIWRALLGWLK